MSLVESLGDEVASTLLNIKKVHACRLDAHQNLSKVGHWHRRSENRRCAEEREQASFRDKLQWHDYPGVVSVCRGLVRSRSPRCWVAAGISSRSVRCRSMSRLGSERPISRKLRCLLEISASHAR